MARCNHSNRRFLPGLLRAFVSLGLSAWVSLSCAAVEMDHPLDLHEGDPYLTVGFLLAFGIGGRVRPGHSFEDLSAAANFPARTGHTMVVYQDRIWVMGGQNVNLEYLTDVWNSPDGLTWNQVSNGLPAGLSDIHPPVALVFDNAMWYFSDVLDGASVHTQRVLRSTDGITWTQTFSQTIGAVVSEPPPVVLVHQGRLWHMQGDRTFDNGDERRLFSRYSTDGTNWISPASDSLLVDTLVSFDGAILGGRMILTAPEGLWENRGTLSGTGRIVRRNTAAPRSERMVYFAGRGFLYGATSFESRDFSNWSPVSALTLYCCHVDWANRSGYDIVTFRNRLWVTGGVVSNQVSSTVLASLGGDGAAGTSRSDGSK